MKTSLLLRAALAATVLLAGPAGAQPAAAPPDDHAPVTREEVMRDLEAWKQAGVENNWNSDSTPDINSPEYVASYKKYEDTVKPAAEPPVRTQ
jgi:hypothetical protein